MTLTIRFWPTIFRAKSLPITTPTARQQRETLILPGHRLDEHTFPLVEPVAPIESIQRHSRVEPTREANSPPTPTTINYIPNPQTPLPNHNPQTTAEPVIDSLDTPSVLQNIQDFNNPRDPRDHHVIDSPALPSPNSFIDDDSLSRFSRYSPRTPRDQRSLNSPADSTRPPTYHTRASQATISTLPLYQEDGDGRISRASSRHSVSTTRARRDRLASLPPLPTPSLSIQKP